MKTFIYSLTLFLVSTASFAELYKWKDKEGNVIYSDKPPFEGAEQLDPPGLTTTPAIKVPEKQPPVPLIEEELPFKYSSFKILSPADDETIRSNPGNISVSFALSPALDLKRGHYLSLSVDGTVVRDKVRSTAGIMLENIDRGSHSITASIKDRKGKTIISSNAVTVHLHRHSSLHKKR